MMLSFDYWMWWIFGAVLLFAEMIVPGVFLLWIGLAAFLVGVIDFFVPLSVVVQLSLFGILSLASVILGRKIYDLKKVSETTTHLMIEVPSISAKCLCSRQLSKRGVEKQKLGIPNGLSKDPIYQKVNKSKSLAQLGLS